MAVRLFFINVIVPIRILEKKCKGGFNGFLQTFKRIKWQDEHLFVTGAMNSMDIEDIVKEFEGLGLVPTEKRDGIQYWKDLCVTEALFGPTARCEWLQFGYDEGGGLAWLKEEDQGAASSPFKGKDNKD